MKTKQLPKLIKKKLQEVYPQQFGEEFFDLVLDIAHKYKKDPNIKRKNRKYKNHEHYLDERDSFIITYANSIKKKGEKPLRTLNRFLDTYVKDAVNGVHILPFYPYSSDDGFSVIDYKKVEPAHGTWTEIKEIGEKYRLMADLVMNHISQKSRWFEKFLAGDARYSDYFLSYDWKIDTSKTFRPREDSVLQKFRTKMGDKYVWATFSRDQIDLNYSNPKVFLEMLEVIMFYLSNNIEVLRLDAVGFLWKDITTRSIHHEHTHNLIKLIRLILEYVAPYALIITETNVPFKENISYLKTGDEAHLVYQFSLPPIVLHTYLANDTKPVKKLLRRLQRLPSQYMFFNFLASHDGIGMLGAKDLLSGYEKAKMVEKIQAHNGRVSFRTLPNKTKSPYELNITYYDAINDPHEIKTKWDVRRFISSQAMLLAARGVPGIYIHSLVGTRNAKKISYNREINRKILDYDEIDKKLSSHRMFRERSVFLKYKAMLQAKNQSCAFDPHSKMRILASDKRLLIIERQKNRKCLIIINTSEDVIKTKNYTKYYDAIQQKKFTGTIRKYGVYFLMNKIDMKNPTCWK